MDAALCTLLVDLTDDRTSVPYVCPLCGFTGETGELGCDVQAALLDAGASLAARE
jgi:hypothetical protein